MMASTPFSYLENQVRIGKCSFKLITFGGTLLKRLCCTERDKTGKLHYHLPIKSTFSKQIRFDKNNGLYSITLQWYAFFKPAPPFITKCEIGLQVTRVLNGIYWSS